MPLPLPLVATARARSCSTLGRVIIPPSKTTHGKNAAVRRRARRIFRSLSRKFRGTVRLDGVLPRPLACGSLIAGAVGLVDVRDFGNERVVGVRVSQHGADGEKNFRDGQSRAPLIPQDVQTDAAIAVDVWVIDAGGEVDLWGLERVVCGEVDGEEEDAARVW